MDYSTLSLDELNRKISQLEGQEELNLQQQMEVIAAYSERAARYDEMEKYVNASKDLYYVLSILKRLFSIIPEIQESYYGFLDDAIGNAYVYLDNRVLLHHICNDFLCPMKDVPKTREAKEAERELIQKMKENIGDPEEIARRIPMPGRGEFFDRLSSL